MKIDTIAPGYAAIDLGDEALFVATANAPVRRFGTFTRDLHALAEWLREQRIEQVAMEATGVYWVGPYDVLEAAGFGVTLFDGGSARNLPGRKSDVQDCQWHAMLHSYGLLRPCFIPPPQIRELREYIRQREDRLGLASASIQHMQRALDLMNVRLHNVLSQLHGVSGLRIVEAILQGERDPLTLSRLCDQRVLKTKQAEVIASLEGHYQAQHLFALGQALSAYRFHLEQVAACDRQIEATFNAANAGRPVLPRVKGRKVKVSRHNAPQVKDLYGQLLTLCDGRDAQLIPAIAPLSWMKLVGELGTDLSRWKTPKEFTAYVGLNPLRHQSGKRRRRVPRRKTRAGQVFREVIMSLAKSKDCAVGEFYRRVKGRRGAPIAIVAAARKLAELYWRVMTHGIEYVEQGLAQYRQRKQEQDERKLRRQAAKLGFALQPLQPSPAMA